MHQSEWDNHFHIDFSRREHQWKEPFIQSRFHGGFVPKILIWPPPPPFTDDSNKFSCKFSILEFSNETTASAGTAVWDGWNIRGIRWLDCLRINSRVSGGKQWRKCDENWEEIDLQRLPFICRSPLFICSTCHLLIAGRKYCSQKEGERQRRITKKQARKLQATLVRNHDPLNDSLTGVKCRATSVAKKHWQCVSSPLYQSLCFP